MYDIHRLRLLLELRRRGTLTAVASALNYSPSTISEQLSRLQVEVGAQLLEPIGRRVRLTPQAEILATHAEIVFRQLEAAEAAVQRSLNVVTGRVRIAAFQTGLLKLLAPALRSIAAHYPGIRVEVFQVEPSIALSRMLAHEYDLVIAEEFPHRPLPNADEIDYDELLADPLRIALPAIDTPDLRDAWSAVARRPWVVETSGSASRDWIQMLCREAGFEPDIRFTTDDLMVQQQLVAEGHAVAILPNLLTVGGQPLVRLVEIPGGPYRRRILTASRRETAEHPAIDACRRALVDDATDRDVGNDPSNADAS